MSNGIKTILYLVVNKLLTILKALNLLHKKLKNWQLLLNTIFLELSLLLNILGRSRVVNRIIKKTNAQECLIIL